MLRTLLLVLGAATPAPGAAPFRVLWDSWFPTECRQFGDKTTAEDFAKFGITANRALDPGIPAVKPQQPVVNGTGTAGDAIILFYENFGLYPAIGSHAGNFSGTAMYECDPAQIVPNEPTWCNGGLPQLANLSAHAAKLRSDIASAIPDPEWAGVAFIDYESWQPVWDWNDNCCPAYQAASIALVRQANPGWSQPEVEAQARLDLEAGALEFLMHTITVVRAERPHTQWSIDGYPGCGDSMDDYSGLLTEGRCPATATAGNDKIQPLLAIQDTLTPMPYLLSLNSSFNTVYLKAVMREAARLAPTKPVWVYSWYEYMLQGAPTVPDKPSCKVSPNSLAFLRSLCSEVSNRALATALAERGLRPDLPVDEGEPGRHAAGAEGDGSCRRGHLGWGRGPVLGRAVLLLPRVLHVDARAGHRRRDGRRGAQPKPSASAGAAALHAAPDHAADVAERGLLPADV